MFFINDVVLLVFWYNDLKLIFCIYEFFNVVNNDYNKNWIIVSMVDSCDFEFVDIVV